MKITIDYKPDTGFIFNELPFCWKEDRGIVREKLNGEHKEENVIFNLAQYFDSDESKNIEMRRDIYRNYSGGENYFFLNYDSDDKLCDIEFHRGAVILVKGVELYFGRNIDQYINSLKEIDGEVIELEEGNYLFKNLKITLANSESNGGAGNGLDYFYATVNIEHLL